MPFRLHLACWLAIVLALAPPAPVQADDDARAAAERREHDLAAYSRLAAAGDARAQFALAGLYERGEGGVPRDPQQAFEWYRKSAEQGHAPAELRIAEAFESRAADNSHKQDKIQARHWFGLAALHGSAAAVTRLVAYAEHGDVEAQLQLGRQYYHGQGVARSEDDAYGWFQRAAAQNAEEAIFAIGRMYERGRGRPQSDAEAVAAYQRAAALGYLPATYNLARLYRLGRGIGANADMARVLYERAAEAGLRAAQLALAMLYEAGANWPQDLPRAVRWYRAAVAQGSPEAMLNLGYLYAAGRGVARDPVEAYALFSAAAARGQGLAAANLEQLGGDLSAAQKDAAGRRAVDYAGPSALP